MNYTHSSLAAHNENLILKIFFLYFLFNIKYFTGVMLVLIEFNIINKKENRTFQSLLTICDAYI